MARKKAEQVRQMPGPQRVVYVDPHKLVPAKWNPRRISQSELEDLAQSIAQYGFVDNVVAQPENQRILGGHQRVKAACMLLDGTYVPYTPTDDDGNPIPLAPLPVEVPVIYTPGLNEKQAKSLCLALNRIGGEWDNGLLPKMIEELYSGLEQYTKVQYPTGFTPKEIENYLTPHVEKGEGPKNLKHSPTLSIAFSNKEARDKLKAYVAGITDGSDTLPGDALLSKLGIV